MKLGIKIKFAGILVLATVLPIAAALIAINVLGYKSYREAEGKRFQGRAEQMADFLTLKLNSSVMSLHDWMAMADFHDRLAAINETAPSPGDDAFARHVVDMEARWPGLAPDSPELDALLANDLASDLKKFRSINPYFSEILVTDENGRLVAATDKTTDYWQANERWWQKGRTTPFQSAHVEGINYDTSAEVYSFDLAIPIRDPDDPEGPVAGVAKGVLQASAIFFELAERVSHAEMRWKCVLPDGRILFAREREPLGTRVVPEARRRLAAADSGWMITGLTSDDPRMSGFTRLPWDSVALDTETQPLSGDELRRQIEAYPSSDLAREVLAREIESIHIVVHSPAAEVLAPVRAQLRNLTVAGIFFILLSTAAGFFIARRELIRPISLLRAAARNISATARLEQRNREARFSPVKLPESTARVLAGIRSIDSSDELGDLSRDFEAMAHRVLQYNEHMKADLTAKTREIQRELDLAREFQEALMPKSYPTVPSRGCRADIELRFHHVYLPTSTVGGDFFDVIKLGEDRAGIFIADVMGHGARSALITAIIGTLLQDFVHTTDDPADLMQLLNRHFLNIMRHCNDFVFVSAFYMVVDTVRRDVTYAAAGHPPPLRGDRNTRRITPLYTAESSGSALGLLPDSVYSTARAPLSEGDIFFLFTDGIVEAVNPRNEEFGNRRLMKVIRDNLDAGIASISDAVLNDLIAFTNTSRFQDDICFVTVEAEKNELARVPDEAEPELSRRE